MTSVILYLIADEHALTHNVQFRMLSGMEAHFPFCITLPHMGALG